MNTTDLSDLIGPELIKRVLLEVSELSEPVMDKEFESFFSSQPGICTFITDLTSDSGQSIRELALFLAFMLNKILTEHKSQPPLLVDERQIIAACKESQNWIERLNETDTLNAKKLSIKDTNGQPYLFQFIITEIKDSGSALTEKEKGLALFISKTLISCLAAGSH